MIYPIYGQGVLLESFCRRAAVKGCTYVSIMSILKFSTANYITYVLFSVFFVSVSSFFFFFWGGGGGVGRSESLRYSVQTLTFIMGYIFSKSLS